MYIYIYLITFSSTRRVYTSWISTLLDLVNLQLGSYMGLLLYLIHLTKIIRESWLCNSQSSLVSFLFSFSSLMWFHNLQNRCDEVAEALTDQGLKAVALHGGRSQSERESALRDFRNGPTNILVHGYTWKYLLLRLTGLFINYCRSIIIIFGCLLLLIVVVTLNLRGSYSCTCESCMLN